jgi:hypothetical protein
LLICCAARGLFSSGGFFACRPDDAIRIVATLAGRYVETGAARRIYGILEIRMQSLLFPLMHSCQR